MKINPRGKHGGINPVVTQNIQELGTSKAKAKAKAKVKAKAKEKAAIKAKEKDLSTE